jgi:hypothetical protein
MVTITRRWVGRWTGTGQLDIARFIDDLGLFFVPGIADELEE